MENNRTIIAIVLIVLLWSGYSLFFAPRPLPQQQEPSVQTTPGEEKLPESGTEVAVTSGQMTEELKIPTVYAKDYQERMLTVSSDYYDINLSTTGATLRSMILKKYRQDQALDSGPYQLIKETDAQVAMFKTSGSEGLAIPADLGYRVLDQSSNQVDVSSSETTISFSAMTPGGLQIIKSYTFHPDSYLIDLKIQLINSGPQERKGTFNLSLVNHWDDSMKSDRYSHVGPISYNGEKLLEDSPEDLDKAAKVYGTDIVWSGFDTKYFAMILNPLGEAKQIQVEKGPNYIENRFISPFFSVAPGQQKIFDYASYLGPKDTDQLTAADHQFVEAKDFGFFRILAQPLMQVLKFFYGFIGNYGFAIMLLTICIKILFWPLTQKSYKSMKGMQKLQPEMQKLREKHKNDKQKLNQEMMTFYKENKVNPLGGCLPMVIQIPVFFALYQVLLGAIELRHAPFMLWITDLSSKDPYYVTPIIMGATMFIQQKMTPTNMDPTQAKIMLMMPVVFTFLFLNFPSGLVVYWLVNNLLTILQQYLIKRQPD